MLSVFALIIVEFLITHLLNKYSLADVAVLHCAYTDYEFLVSWDISLLTHSLHYTYLLNLGIKLPDPLRF